MVRRLSPLSMYCPPGLTVLTWHSHKAIMSTFLPVLRAIARRNYLVNVRNP